MESNDYIDFGVFKYDTLTWNFKISMCYEVSPVSWHKGKSERLRWKAAVGKYEWAEL